MKTLKVELALVPADAVARAEFSLTKLTIRKFIGAIIIEGFSLTTTGLRHKFIIKSGVYPGIDKIWEFNPYTAVSILCISFSLANPKVLLSPIIWKYTPISVEENRPPGSAPKFFKAQKANIKNINISISEEKVLNIIERIILYKVSSKKDKWSEANIAESINSYQLAIMTINGFQRFTFLFHALEKAANAEKDVKGKSFDAQASKITGFTTSEIEKLRVFNNRIKHVFKNDKDIETLEDKIKNFSELVFELKRATDKAILYRLNERQSK